jgi:hypothetical protein
VNRVGALLGVAGVATAGVAFAIRIAPASHDFGKVGLGNSMGKSFTISVIGGGRDSLTTLISGPDAGDFRLSRGNCAPVIGLCDATVAFQPRSKGVKTASLDVYDRNTQKTSATLTGTGVDPVCTNNVVFCNYAFLYSGNFDWNTATETVKVTIIDGVATCNGTVSLLRRPKGSVTGTGLVAVEFVRGAITDSAGNEGPERLVYRITVACPSPAVPASAEDPATISRPAELGDFFQQTYNQPANEVAPRTLVGSVSSPVEGEGTVSVTWSLMRK